MIMQLNIIKQFPGLGLLFKFSEKAGCNATKSYHGHKK